MIRHILNFTFDSNKSTDQSFYMVLKKQTFTIPTDPLSNTMLPPC